MNRLRKAVEQRDADALRRIAGQGNTVQTEGTVDEQQAARVFNALFRQLRATFPAITAHVRTQDDLDDFRRTWMLTFAENGITTIAQVNAGMRIARQQETPWVPSAGQFVAWCRDGCHQVAGLLTEDELVALVHRYCRQRGFLSSPEAYPWQHPAHYWMVTALYSGMRNQGWTEGGLRAAARRELSAMAARIRRGAIIPEPVLTIGEKTSRPPMQREEALRRIAETRKRLGLAGDLDRRNHSLRR